MSTIYPFQIEGTKEYPDGTMVSYYVAKKVFDETGNRHQGLRAALFVPAGQDINEYLYENLQKEGWIV